MAIYTPYTCLTDDEKKQWAEAQRTLAELRKIGDKRAKEKRMATTGRKLGISARELKRLLG